MKRANDPARRVRVELIDEEHIVEHGSSETTWFVRVNASWVSAANLPGAEVVRLEARPGTVWRHAVTLELELGARLLRVESRPLVEQRTPLEHLKRAPRTPRKVRRTERWVGKNGELLSAPPTAEPAPPAHKNPPKFRP